MRYRPVLRTAGLSSLLAGLLVVSARALGPVPPLGPLLDPISGVWAVARAAMPAPRSEALIPGLSQAVQVRFDRRWVPHIFAATEDDAYRAMGYVVARDRLFQMELQTRAASGRLTEWLGRGALAADRETRRLGIPWGVERKRAALDTAAAPYHALVAYAEGVNAWIDAMGPADLPLEYRLLNVRPRRWESRFTQDFFMQMGRILGLNDASLQRARAAALVGSTSADALFPINNPLQEPIEPDGQAPWLDPTPFPPPGAPESLLAPPQRPASVGDDGPGSNNWAVAPGRAAHHYALLAGDPHLTLTLPSIWYEAHIVVPGVLDVAGVGFPGAPGIVIGFNRSVAWSFTNTGSDVDDYYAETVDDPKHPSRYRLDGSWHALERRVETYRGRRGELLAVDTILFTHRGPLERVRGRWLSHRWTVLEPSRDLEGFLAMQRARSAPEWLAAIAGLGAPAQNALVADRSGAIAIRSTGRYPLRPGDGRGDLIREGSSSASDWRGDLPVDRYPQASNPLQGFLASANQQPVDPRRHPAYLGSNWYAPWRAIRINQLLRGDSLVTPDDMRRFQTDPESPRAEAFVPYFLAAAERTQRGGKPDPELSLATEILRSWDRRYTRENRGAGLFELALEELNARTWDELDGEVAPGSAVLYRLLQFPANKWWDDRRTAAVEDRDQVLVASLRAAMQKARGRFGPPGGDGWRWDRIQHTNIYHLLRIPVFSALGLPAPGGPSTLSPSSGDGTEGASWRMVVELGPEVHAWGTYPGGQSGNPVSSRYRDRLPAWRQGSLDSLRFPARPEDLQGPEVLSVLTLRPAS